MSLALWARNDKAWGSRIPLCKRCQAVAHGFLLLFESEEFQRCGGLKILRYVSSEDMALVLPEIEFHHLSVLTEIDLIQIYPRGVWGDCGFEEVDQAFLMGNRSPKCCDSVRD